MQLIRHMRRNRGFTFIEIMIVIVIVLVLAAVAIPQMGGTFRRTRLKSAARDVTGLLRYARDIAVLSEQFAEVRFDPERDAYQVYLVDEFGEPLEDVERRRDRRRRGEDPPLTLGDDVGGVRKLPERVHFAVIYTAADLTVENELPRVIFSPDGSATPATIGLQDDDKNTMSVEIYRTTGLTRVARGLPPEEPDFQRLYVGPGSD